MSNLSPLPESTSRVNPTMPTWKRVLLKSVGVGLGIGLGLAIAIAVFVWHSSRPVPPKPWNTNAITASFSGVDTYGDDSHFRFIYILENHTDQDYRVNASDLLLSAVIVEKGSLAGGSNVKFQENTIFLPAKQHSQVEIELLGYSLPSFIPDKGFIPDNPTNFTPDERRHFQQSVLSYVATNLPRLNGFAAYDDAHRYRIDFPNGWKQNR